MGFLDKFFSNKKNKVAKSNESAVEHAVIIYFNYELEGMEHIYALRDKLETAIENNNLGEYDGHEMAIDYSDGSLYMYGPNAELLFNGIKPILETTTFLNGAKAKLRFGPPEDGIKEIIVDIKTE
ncbi:hypothetical protein [uncultured Psychroserpens sp.]|uniref:hypothetical protein n=1 Tax=uncultured Psychroserpens sp. TaxID=255436 RepID=UPI0026158452|nr:hypothetical protein [uncultured Psychroserpens sp.]